MAGTALVGSLIEELTSMVAEYLLEEVSLVISFRDDLSSLCDELESIKSLLKDAGGKRNSTSVCNWLEKLEDFLDDAVDIVEDCGAAGNFWNPIFRRKMGRKIKNLNERIKKIKDNGKYIKYVASLLDVNARLESANSQDKRERSNAITVLHPVGIEIDIQNITELVLKEEGPRVIAVVGMGGQGKTLLVQSVFNGQRVEQLFERRFWVVVSQKPDVTVHDQIGNQKKLEDLSTEKIKELFGHLEGKRCLFVFDDVWDRDALLRLHNQIALTIKGKDKIIITTRDRKAAEGLGDPLHHIHKMKYLSEEDSWTLFCIHAFPDRPVHSLPEGLREDNCKPICKRCDGLPLAIKTIGASMARERRLPNDWKRALSRLNTLEAMNDRVLSSLRLSYEVLPDNLKSCFLYFSVFPTNIEIECEYLVHMWIAQGFVSAPVEDAYNVGRSYIDELVDRCLIEVSQVGGDEQVERCKIHYLLHDLAVSDSLKQIKCLLNPGEQLVKLPIQKCRGLRRISLNKNDISTIKEAISCPGLRTLLLGENCTLTSICSSFFKNLKYLAVLDLSLTAITSLPESIGELRRLKFLNLSGTNILELPEFLSDLRRLQFLDISHCSDLSKLHSGIEKHKCMQYLNVESCGKLEWLPKGISKLGHLQTLKCALSDTRADAKALQWKDLKELTLLQHLSLQIEDIQQEEEETFEGMKKVRTLSLVNNGSGLLHLPMNMELMKRLEKLSLLKCMVPNWIHGGLENLMDLELQYDDSLGNAYKGLERAPNLKRLHLSYNNKCIEFPKEFGEPMAFPKLEELLIHRFDSLRKFPQLQDTAMPMLKYFRLRWCSKLENIAQGLESLKNLEEVELLRREGDHDLWRGQWRQILKDRRIKLKVSTRDQFAIDEIDTIDIAVDED